MRYCKWHFFCFWPIHSGIKPAVLRECWLEYGNDFQFYDSASIPKSAEKIVGLYLQETAKYGVDNVALLSPYRQKTETGVNALNELLREKINPPAPDKTEVVHGTRRFRCGDKVMQIKNCDEISNGDIGYITNESEQLE